MCLVILIFPTFLWRLNFYHEQTTYTGIQTPPNVSGMIKGVTHLKKRAGQPFTWTISEVIIWYQGTLLVIIKPTMSRLFTICLVMLVQSDSQNKKQDKNRNVKDKTMLPLPQNQLLKYTVDVGNQPNSLHGHVCWYVNLQIRAIQRKEIFIFGGV